MTSLTLLLVAGGSLALLAMLLGVVALARKLDRDSGKTDAPAPVEKTSDGSLAATLATLAAHAGVHGAKAVTPENIRKAVHREADHHRHRDRRRHHRADHGHHRGRRLRPPPARSAVPERC